MIPSSGCPARRSVARGGLAGDTGQRTGTLPQTGHRLILHHPGCLDNVSGTGQRTRVLQSTPEHDQPTLVGELAHLQAAVNIACPSATDIIGGVFVLTSPSDAPFDGLAFSDREVSGCEVARLLTGVTKRESWRAECQTAGEVLGRPPRLPSPRGKPSDDGPLESSVGTIVRQSSMRSASESDRTELLRSSESPIQVTVARGASRVLRPPASRMRP
jgi:hypothetical protein